MTTAITPVSRIRQALNEASTPKESFDVEAQAKAGMAYHKEQREFEQAFPYAIAYIDARIKTTELIEPTIKHGDQRRFQGISTDTLGDYGFSKLQWSRRKKELAAKNYVGEYQDDCVQKWMIPTPHGLVGFYSSIREPELPTPEPVPHGQVSIHQGDMMDIVPGLGQFDLIVADPPYNVTEWEWDKVDEFIHQTGEWLRVCKDALRQQYNMFWFCSPQYAADIEMVIRDLGLPIQSRIVWHRRNMSKGSKASNKFIDSWEMIYHMGNKELNFPDEWSEAWFDVQTHAVPQTNFKDTKYHPTQKPKELIRLLVEFGSRPGDRVLDPFAGAGTTGVVGDGRECVLVERDKGYVDIIKARFGV